MSWMGRSMRSVCKNASRGQIGVSAVEEGRRGTAKPKSVSRERDLKRGGEMQGSGRVTVGALHDCPR